MMADNSETKREGKELYDMVAKVCTDWQDVDIISPILVANTVMSDMDFGRDLHRLGYIGCNLTLRQIARTHLRQKFDPADSANADDDLFPDTLQERYPRRPKLGQEPVYVLRALLTGEDIEYNATRMEQSGAALIRHASALREYGRLNGVA